MKKKIKIILSALSVFLMLMTGCGGDSGSSQPSTPATDISGVAAAGAPIDGVVYIKGAHGNTQKTFIGLSGTFSFTEDELSNIAVPYIIYAEGTANGETKKVYSAGFNLGTINITPITDFILKTALAGSADAAYDTWSASSITQKELSNAETKIQAQIQPVLNAAGAPISIDLLTTSFNADGTGIDTVLDVLDISFSHNIATVTNIITGSTYTDNVTTTIDDVAVGLPLSDEAGTEDAMIDAVAMYDVMQILVGLYATDRPTATELNTTWAPHMADDFLGWGQTKTTLLTGWTEENEGPPIGIEVAMSIVSEMSPADLSGTTYTKGYWTRYNYSAPYDYGSFVSAMVYDGTKWLWYGDQRWIDIHIDADAYMIIDSLGAATYNTGLSLDLQDVESIAYTDNGVRSAIVTGPGLPAAGVVMEDDGYDFTIFGGFESYYIMIDDVAISSITDNSIYTIRLYMEPPALVSLSDTPVATYTQVLTRRPILNADLDASIFPAITDPTDHTLATANIPGTLDVSWANTSSVYVKAVGLSWTNSNSGYEVEDRLIDETVTSTTLDTTGKPAPDNNFASMWLYSTDIFERKYEIVYKFMD